MPKMEVANMLTYQKIRERVLGKTRKSQPLNPIPTGVKTVHLYRGMVLDKKLASRLQAELESGIPLKSPALHILGDGARDRLFREWAQHKGSPYLFLVECNGQGQQFGVNFWTEYRDYSGVYGGYVVEGDVPIESIVNRCGTVEVVTGPVETMVYNPRVRRFEY